MKKSLIIIAFMFLFFGDITFADKIELEGNLIVEGEILSYNGSEFLLDSPDGTRTIPEYKVKSFVIERKKPKSAESSASAKSISNKSEDAQNKDLDDVLIYLHSISKKLDQIQSLQKSQSDSLKKDINVLNPMNMLKVISHKGFKESINYDVNGKFVNYGSSTLYGIIVRVDLIGKNGQIVNTAYDRRWEKSPIYQNQEFRFAVKFKKPSEYDSYKITLEQNTKEKEEEFIY